MVGRRSTPKLTEREKILHNLSNKLSILLANIAVLQMTYTEGETKLILADMQAAAEEAVEQFDRLRRV